MMQGSEESLERPVNEAFERAMIFFNMGSNAYNKVQDPHENSSSSIEVPSEGLPLISSDPHRLSANASQDQMPEGPLLSVGKELHDSGDNWGNCQEMCSVAAYLLSKALPPGTHIYFCEVDDHAFLVVGGTIENNKFETVEELVAQGPRESRAVDVWAGFSCPLSEYIIRFNAATDQWSANHIRILKKSRIKTFAWNPTSPDYRGRFFIEYGLQVREVSTVDL